VSGPCRIIIGADGSPCSLQALRYAAGLAREDDATLIPVLAWQPPGGDLADRRQPCAYLREVWKDAAWQRLWAALDAGWGGPAPTACPVQPLVLRGPPGPVLVEVADQAGDLLVIGTGRRGWLRNRLGPRVARYCLAHPRCPVLAVPPSELDQAAGHGLRGWAFRHRALHVG